MRLQVHILKPEFAELFSREIAPVKHRSELHSLSTGEFASPAGLPLNISVNCDSSIDHGDVVVNSGASELLRAGPLRLGFQAIVLLPTEEKMLVAVLRK